MRYHYNPGTCRWFRWQGWGDIRGYRAPEGWTVSGVAQFDEHPITGKPFKDGAQWWICETRDDP